MPTVPSLKGRSAIWHMLLALYSVLLCLLLNIITFSRRANLNTSLPVATSSTARTDKLNTSMAVSNTHRSGGRTVHGPGAPQDPSGKGRIGAPPLLLAQPSGAGRLSRSAPGPPLPRPVLPRERGYLDKFVEFLVSYLLSITGLVVSVCFRWEMVQRTGLP